MTNKKTAIASVLTIIMIVSVLLANMVTVSAASWKTGCFDNGYTAKGYTTVTLNSTKKDGYIKIFTYSSNGKKTTADIHITLRDNRGKWLCEFDTKSGTKLRLARDHKAYRIYVAKKYYPYNSKKIFESTFKQGDQFINDGKCQMWAINTVSGCYI